MENNEEASDKTLERAEPVDPAEEGVTGFMATATYQQKSVEICPWGQAPWKPHGSPVV